MRTIFLTLLPVMMLSAGPANASAKYIQRTMSAFESSTKENPAHVRVMVYGQSITAQPWTKMIEEDLKKRYPTVDLEFPPSLF